MINYIIDSALPIHSSLTSKSGILDKSNALVDNLVITAEHSPENPYEFYRLREFRPRDDDSKQPSLLVVYDSPSHEKSRCNAVFDFESDGIVKVTNNGR